jgi:L-arabinose isomerase
MKTGIFSIGLDTYWPPFAGLPDTLTGYHIEIREHHAGMGTMLVKGDMVEGSENPF